ncbi:pseudouridine synthase [Microbacterium halophytorum]|uniref:pseudouridine synthase n=1 Tax=Microbacterium halophytorum TaxID=2067568 RepID=UPI000CFDFC29|nr:pseudouridine synthase [Microbacterium halophytorum]
MARLRAERVLPPRDGIAAARISAPGGTRTHAAAGDPVPASVRDWLRDVVIPNTLGREQAIAPLRPEYFVDEGELTTEHGRRVSLDDPVAPGGFYFFHKPYPAEPRVPFEIGVVHSDRDLLVIDKPHFLASTPNGRFVRESAVTRLRVEHGEDDLVAIHRLDRVTAGLLVLSRRPATRGLYQVLFQQRRIRKTYRALAWLPDELPLGIEPGGAPVDVRNRLEKSGGVRAVQVVPGEPNALTSIRMLRAGSVGGRAAGEFELTPHTGKTHQLRVHMNALGMPLVGDPVYPRDLEPDAYDFSEPLQLLAAELRFDDPITGAPRAFASRMSLSDLG